MRLLTLSQQVPTQPASWEENKQ